MKKIIPSLLFCALWAIATSAQITNDPVVYMDQVSKEHELVTERYMTYHMVSAHSDNEREIDSKRIDCVKQLVAGLIKLKNMKGFGKDESLRDEAISVFEEELKIYELDMVEVIQLKSKSQSTYDAMEAYFKLQKKAHAKVHKAMDRFQKAYTNFAAKNEVKLTAHEEDEKDRIMQEIVKVNDYSNDIFLVSFKLDKLHSEFWEPFRKDKKGIAESAIEKMTKGMEDVKTQLKAVGPYQDYDKCVKAVEELIEVSKELAEKHYPALIRGIGKAKGLTQAEVDAYNNAVKFYNEEYVTRSNDLNKVRDEFRRKFTPKEGSSM